MQFSLKTLRNDDNTMERDSDSERPSEGRERDGERVVERWREREKRRERAHFEHFGLWEFSEKTERAPLSWIFEKEQTLSF